MKANEFRIGNIVKCNRRISIVYLIEKDRVGVSYIKRRKVEPFGAIMPPASCKPVPITNEVLSNAGFKDESRYWSHDVEYFNICQGYNDGKWYLSVGPGEYSEGHGIEFVHQLQNLFHALTGEEL